MDNDNKNINNPEQVNEQSIEELRRIITGLGNSELEKIRRWLSDTDAFAEDISTVIPVSIKHLVEKRIVLPQTLLPIIEEAIESSVITDPHKLANALFPIMGPAIRKAVREDLKKMIQSMNSVLENSFSPKRLGWRFQSMFSSRSYADIVMSHILIYQVRQVFLMHRKTGLLLWQEIDKSISHKDPDMVSAMLSAINDFVRDSFDVNKDQEIQTIQVGEFNVLIEQGPHAILAGIIEGNPPQELRDVFQQTLEQIHLDFFNSLVHFDGDTSAFEDTKDIIRNCLQKQAKTKKKKPVIIIILFIVLLILLGYWAYMGIEEKIRWNDYIRTIKNIPGVIITDEGKENGKMMIAGMRDPLSQDPVNFIQDYDFKKEEVISKWQHYYSLDEFFIMKRAILKLDPPNTVDLSYEGGVLFANGIAKQKWIDFAKNNYQNIIGVDSLNLDSLNREKQVDYQSYKREIDKYLFNYEYEVIELNDEQRLKLEELKEIIKQIHAAGADPSDFEVELIGYTLSAGNIKSNKEYILRRADIIRDELIKMGIQPYLITTNVHVFDTNKISNISPRSVSVEMKIK